jgi:hypothetical protein
MRNYFLFILVMLVSMAGITQPMLGSGRVEVMKMIEANPNLHDVVEDLSSDGSPFIAVINGSDDVLKWFFNGGVVDQYMVVMDADDVNTYVKLLNREYVFDGAYQWSDYSTGRRIYYHMLTIEKYYMLTVTWYDLNP